MPNHHELKPPLARSRKARAFDALTSFVFKVVALSALAVAVAWMVLRF